LRLLVILLLGLAGQGRAQAPVDTDVASVVTLGYWKTESGEGPVRVVVRTAGFEHVASSIRIEWIAQAGPERPARIQAIDSTLAIPDRMYVLDVPAPYSNFEGMNFYVCGTHAYDSSKKCWRVWVGSPGRADIVHQ
jgi:hypothetical protein